VLPYKILRVGIWERLMKNNGFEAVGAAKVAGV